MTASSISTDLPISALLDTNVSFPFSVTGGLRRRLERQQALLGAMPTVERFNYQELRGSASAKHRVVRPMVVKFAAEIQPMINRAPAAAIAEPVIEPRPFIAPPPVAIAPVLPEPVVEAPVQPLLAMPAPVEPAPVAPSFQIVEPAPPAPSFHIKEQSRTWNVVDMSTKEAVVETELTDLAPIQIETGWGVREQAPANFADWSTVKQAPTKLSDTFDVDLDGHRAEVTVSKAEAHALENLPSSNIRSILMNAAVCAVLITSLFGILTAISHH